MNSVNQADAQAGFRKYNYLEYFALEIFLQSDYHGL